MDKKISILGENIKRIREGKNLTGYKLSQISGVSKATLSQIENGDRQNLSSATLAKLAEALEVTAQDLLFEKDKNEYIALDIEESIQILLSSDELSLDGKELTQTEKSTIELYLLKSLSLIRTQRSDLGD